MSGGRSRENGVAPLVGLDENRAEGWTREDLIDVVGEAKLAKDGLVRLHGLSRHCMAVSDKHHLVAGQSIHLTVHKAACSETGSGLHEARSRADGRGEPAAVLSTDPGRLMSLHGKLTVGDVAELLGVRVLGAVGIVEANDVLDAG